jgi:hypothetical protein
MDGSKETAKRAGGGAQTAARCALGGRGAGPPVHLSDIAVSQPDPSHTRPAPLWFNLRDCPGAIPEAWGQLPSGDNEGSEGSSSVAEHYGAW